MQFRVQLVLGQEEGDCDCMEEGAHGRVEMSQRLFRPKGLGIGGRSDLSLTGGSHTQYTI